MTVALVAAFGAVAAVLAFLWWSHRRGWTRQWWWHTRCVPVVYLLCAASFYWIETRAGFGLLVFAYGFLAGGSVAYGERRRVEQARREREAEHEHDWGPWIRVDMVNRYRECVVCGEREDGQISWRCDVCGAERPDRAILTRSRTYQAIGGHDVTMNARYCSDRWECVDGVERVLDDRQAVGA